MSKYVFGDTFSLKGISDSAQMKDRVKFQVAKVLKCWLKVLPKAAAFTYI